MIRTTFALVLLAGLAGLLGSARADPPVTAGAAVVPYYGAAYGGAGLSAGDGKRIVELLESIDRRLEALEQRGGPPVAQKAKGLDQLAVAKARCASCHSPANAEAKGGDFVLLTADGALKPLSGRERARIKEAVEGGAMPPNRKLTADEKAAFR